MASRSADTRARRVPARWLLLALLAAFVACGQRPTPQGGAYSHQVTIRGTEIPVELALTPEEKARGLSERDALAAGAGMIFPYAQPSTQAFWMNGMRFDIDIVWIREGRIVDVTSRVPRPPPGASDPGMLPSYRPREPVDLVLEVAAGTADAEGWKVGDAVRVEPPLR